MSKDPSVGTRGGTPVLPYSRILRGHPALCLNYLIDLIMERKQTEDTCGPFGNSAAAAFPWEGASEGRVVSSLFLTEGRVSRMQGMSDSPFLPLPYSTTSTQSRETRHVGSALVTLLFQIKSAAKWGGGMFGT